jgi:hypothetical protein
VCIDADMFIRRTEEQCQEMRINVTECETMEQMYENEVVICLDDW